MPHLSDFTRLRGLSDAALLLALATLVWVGGPYLGLGQWQPLRSVPARLLAIALVVVGWAVWRWLRQWRAKLRQRRMADALADGGGDSQTRADEEQARLRGRFAEAMKLLRRRRREGHGLDVLPWYLLIGAPGSGKSTLLEHSGQNFPLQQQFGAQPLAGVGGTRSCDWWFADRAVFLDSAGRWTTQESDATADAAAWQGFLGLLRRHRRQPLNGVIVAVSASDLLDPDDARRAQHARTLRRRLDELGERLRATVPVYLVLTKCDLIAGFTDFFADLDAPGRAQVWGLTLPAPRAAAGPDPTTLFPVELERLLERIDARVIDRLRDGRDPYRRATMLSFPQQLRLLQPALADVVQSAFGAHGYGAQPWLRGMYLTSGTQQGHAMDRVMSAVAGHFGLAMASLPPALDKPRTYFVARLLEEVIFAEAGLAGGHARGGRRWRVLQLAAWVGLSVSTLLLLSLLAGSYAHNAQLIADVRAVLQQYPAGARREADTEQGYYVAALQRFDILVKARDTALPPGRAVPWSRRVGLYQGAALAQDVQRAYLRDLNALLLPALGEALRDGLDEAGNAPQRLYQLLKGYLMLGEPARRQVGQLASLAMQQWRGLFPQYPALRAALDTHLRALLSASAGARALPLDRAQVERTRASLRTAQLPALVYGGLSLAQAGRGAQAPRLDRRLGLLGDVFQRRSGVPLSEPLPALFTREAFQGQIDGGIDQAVRQFAADDWVLGSAPLDPLARSQLARGVLALYQRDYIAAWQGLMDDLQLRPVATTAQASAVAAKLGGPGSPLKALLSLLREHTTALGVQPAQGQETAADPSPRAEAEPIERHFEALNRLSDPTSGGALDQALATLNQMSRSLLTAGVGGADQNDPALLIAAQQAGQLPPPLQGWVAALAGQSRALVADGAGDALRSRERQAAGQDCALFVRGRFPFVAQAAAEIPLRDFAELFAPGGRLDRFFQQSIADKVDTGTRNWRWNEATPQVGADDVLQRAQLAARIQQMFFAGGAQPRVDFEVVLPAQSGVGRLLLEVDGQRVETQAGAAASQSMHWPGPQPGMARLSAWDIAGRPLPPVEYRGAWAWFRLLQAGALRPTGDMRYAAQYPSGQGEVRLELRPASLRHPFADTTLQQFRCP
ncbi:type VI secretion system membrane subunit TssM [Xanthomonas translucens]|uniref:type VI secretion system membrane subunit TssM n=1 Tax=Xanthomonas campestris pv. translucens TaxID=343 RepID=UPI00272BEDD9|nr:type VI secretion system membrane subunit TssM [Xanthomonas translucens]WLA11184.1 type VI secretion system membrane subunit TssM [Xanthomonas translucens]